MPVVPITLAPTAPASQQAMAEAMRKLAEPYALMAAATMHKEGRLIEKETDNCKEPDRS